VLRLNWLNWVSQELVSTQEERLKILFFEDKGGGENLWGTAGQTTTPLKKIHMRGVSSRDRGIGMHQAGVTEENINTKHSHSASHNPASPGIGDKWSLYLQKPIWCPDT